MEKQGFTPQYVIEGKPRNRHFKITQGSGFLRIRNQRASMVIGGNNRYFDSLALSLNNLDLDASALPYLEPDCVNELDMVGEYDRAKKHRTTKPRLKTYDSGYRPSKIGGFKFSSTAREVEEERLAKDGKRRLIDRRLIPRSQIILLNTVVHSPCQLEQTPSINPAKQGMVEAMIIARGGDPKYRAPKTIGLRGGNIYQYKSTK